MKYIVSILIIMCSYKFLEVVLKFIFPKLIKEELWKSVLYYIWGAAVIIAAFIVPENYILIIPRDISTGVFFLVLSGIYLHIICAEDMVEYYPRKENKVEYFNFVVAKPIMEEVAFRGIILPITMIFFDDITIIIIALNALIYTIFNFSYIKPEVNNNKRLVMVFILGAMSTYFALALHSILFACLAHILINLGVSRRYNKIYNSSMGT